MRALVLLLVAVLAGSAAADVVCQTKKGAVVLRTACKKRETVATLPIDAPKGPPGENGSAAPAPVRLVDANGAPVGVYAEPGTEDNATFVLFEFASGFAYLQASPTGMLGGTTLFYESADCSGTPLLFHDQTRFVREGAVLGTTAYAPGDPIATHQMASREYEPFGSPCSPSDVTLPNGRCCATSALSFDAGPAVALFDVSSLATPMRLEP
jgi:hypothetical protein